MARRAKRMKIANGRPISTLINVAVWITGVLVSLAVGFGMIGWDSAGDPVLKIPFIPVLITIWAGWVVVILTVLSVILAIVERM